MLEIISVTTEGKELEIVRQLFAGYQKELDEDLCFQSFDSELKEPLKKYGPPTGIIYLALFNGTPAGCIALTDLPATNERKSCEMKRLFVLPAFRKHQIGRRLVEQLLETAKSIGYEIMKLDTLDKLQPAIRLYRQYGFLETTAYYPNPLPGVIYMEKVL